MRELQGIFHHGEVNQIVVLDHVGLGDNHVLSQFDPHETKQPAFFRIDEVEGEGSWHTFYKLTHLKSGVVIECYDGAWLYDIEVRKDWALGKRDDRIASQEREIALLVHDKDLLLSILGNVTVVTTEAVVKAQEA